MNIACLDWARNILVWAAQYWNVLNHWATEFQFQNYIYTNLVPLSVLFCHQNEGGTLWACWLKWNAQKWVLIFIPMSLRSGRCGTHRYDNSHFHFIFIEFMYIFHCLYSVHNKHLSLFILWLVSPIRSLSIDYANLQRNK